MGEAKVGMQFAKLPSKRFIEVKEIGELAMFLCSPATASITGIALSIDDAWTARRIEVGLYDANVLAAPAVSPPAG